MRTRITPNTNTFHAVTVTGFALMVKVILHINHYNTLIKNQVKDTQRENIPSNKTQTLTKIMNMSTWEIGTLNQLFEAPVQKL